MKSARKKRKERNTNYCTAVGNICLAFLVYFMAHLLPPLLRRRSRNAAGNAGKKSKRKRGKYCKILKNVAAKGREEKRGQATAAVKLYEEVSTASGNEAHGQKCQETDAERGQQEAAGCADDDNDDDDGKKGCKIA